MKGIFAAVLALVAISLVVLLGIGGLALDSARGYLVKARLARGDALGRDLLAYLKAIPGSNASGGQ